MVIPSYMLAGPILLAILLFREDLANSMREVGKRFSANRDFDKPITESELFLIRVMCRYTVPSFGLSFFALVWASERHSDVVSIATIAGVTFIVTLLICWLIYRKRPL